MYFKAIVFFTLYGVLSLNLSFAQPKYTTSSPKCHKPQIKATEFLERQKRLKILKAKNTAYYKKYKNNLSIKIKTSSNLFIISAKTETLLLKMVELKKTCIKKECKKCLKKLKPISLKAANTVN
ncbi:MAG: hypothetical protein ISR65_10000 [Bacteriovoracaceae bacterium]|nr:hypothetical protein [Bacteriovoracaceae bacterium]